PDRLVVLRLAKLPRLSEASGSDEDLGADGQMEVGSEGEGRAGELDVGGKATLSGFNAGRELPGDRHRCAGCEAGRDKGTTRDVLEERSGDRHGGTVAS